MSVGIKIVWLIIGMVIVDIYMRSDIELQEQMREGIKFKRKVNQQERDKVGVET